MATLKQPCMRKQLTRLLICAALCSAPTGGFVRADVLPVSVGQLYKEGKTLFQERNYAAAVPVLRAFVAQRPEAGMRQEAEYMLACAAYELKDEHRKELLRTVRKLEGVAYLEEL